MQPDPNVDNIRPGLGLKLLRDSVESANMVAMYTVDGQSSWNFFENSFTNHIPNAKHADTKTLSKKFSEQTEWITEVGLSDMARYDQFGVETSNPVFPFAVRFEPTGNINYPDAYHGNFTDDLKSIPTGSLLYKVYAMNKPCELGGTESYIGDIVTTSVQTTSNWGDKHFFIRHQDFADDVTKQPTWGNYASSYKRGDSFPYGCPFAFLLQ